MVKVVRETELDQLIGSEKYWGYNCMDCCVTWEVYDVLVGKMNPQHWSTYKFRMACQAPAMAMMLRGIRVNEEVRRQHIGYVKGKIGEGTDELQGMVAQWWSKVGKVPSSCRAGGKHQWPRNKRRKIGDAWVVVEAVAPEQDQTCLKCGTKRIDKVPFEPTSHQQVKKLLYEDMSLPRQFNKQRKVSVDKECLERLSRGKGKAHAGLIMLIRQVRLWDKLRGMLEAKLDLDGRWRYSLNIGATETGRPSSSESPMSTGSNTQNIPEQMRDMFTSDPGWTMFNADLKTAESYFVAHKAGDEKYIEAHKGDVHTMVCRELYPELPWSKNPDPVAKLKEDKLVAETNPPWSPEPGHTYRFHSKRRQHGGNYGMTAFAMAIQLHIKVEQAQRDIVRYFKQFPRIPMWHQWVRQKVRSTGRMVSALGMQRQFFGRMWGKDGDHTVREALAFEPQNVIADLVQIAMWHIWQEFDPGDVRLFQNGYDSLLGQVRDEALDKVAPRLVELMEMAVEVEDIDGQVRVMVIPAEMSVGRNWGKKSEKNPGGMREWQPNLTLPGTT